ncbi:MAG: hypothetical protein LBI80_00345, partial [Endomicrobium sp.]|nr:hypothetical protein [Endomicrobium sp.]
MQFKAFAKILLAQRIDINSIITTTYTVAGNGVFGGTNNGEVSVPYSGPWSEFPTDSSDNTILIHSSMSNSVFGGINYPFDTTPV